MRIFSVPFIFLFDFSAAAQLMVGVLAHGIRVDGVVGTVGNGEGINLVSKS